MLSRLFLTPVVSVGDAAPAFAVTSVKPKEHHKTSFNILFILSIYYVILMCHLPIAKLYPFKLSDNTLKWANLQMKNTHFWGLCLSPYFRNFATKIKKTWQTDTRIPTK